MIGTAGVVPADQFEKTLKMNAGKPVGVPALAVADADRMPPTPADAAAAHLADSCCARLQQAMDRHRPDKHRARLRAWVETGLGIYLDSAALHGGVRGEPARAEHHVRDAAAVAAQLAALLRSGDAAGVWEVEDATLAAVILFSALRGVAEDAAAAGPTADPAADRRRRARALSRFFEQALRPDEADGEAA